MNHEYPSFSIYRNHVYIFYLYMKYINKNMLQKLFKALGVTSKRRTTSKKSVKKQSKRKPAVKKSSKKKKRTKRKQKKMRGG